MVKLERNTKETQIKLEMSFGTDRCGLEGKSGVGFFDHMLNSFAVHGGFYIKLDVTGDLHVDCHHTIEDIGIVMGKALEMLAGDKKGIARFGESFIPMDEALAFCALDFSGRGFLHFDADFASGMIGDYDSQMTEEFFRALATNSATTLHLRLLYGKNDHHKTEALYKAAAHAYRKALTKNSDILLSAKGSL